MNTEALFLFLILLLGLLLCSFLGGNCDYEGFTGNFSGTFTSKPDSTNMNNSRRDKSKSKTASTGGASTGSKVNYDNYNHFSGSSTKLASGTTFYGENGGSVVVTTNTDGTQSLQVTFPNKNEAITFKLEPSYSSTSDSKKTPTSSVESYQNRTSTTYYGPDGETATVLNTSDGQQSVNIKTPTGSYTYTQSGTYYNKDNTSSTQYYGSTGSTIQSSANTLAYEEPYGESSNKKRRHSNNNKYNDNTSATTNSSTGFLGSTNYNDQYYSTLPKGIPASQIPMGQEDLYILKSQIVPPVCPACPSVNISSSSASSPNETKCPACPPCGRCPESNFECKKIPNYSAIDNQYLPMPVLNDFSTFGM